MGRGVSSRGAYTPDEIRNCMMKNASSDKTIGNPTSCYWLIQVNGFGLVRNITIFLFIP